MESELKVTTMSEKSKKTSSFWRAKDGDIVIEILQEKDAERMVEILRDNLDPFEEAGSVLAAINRRLHNFIQVYTEAGSVYLVVKDRVENRLVGGAGIGPFAGLSPSEGIAEIRELVIDASYRGQGLGALLLKACLEWAEKFGYSRIYLETTPQMQHAQELFRRFHFKPVTLQKGKKTEASDKQISQLPCYFMLDHK